MKSIIGENIAKVRNNIPDGVTLVVVSKTYPADVVMEAYNTGERIFGENRPQEMCNKQTAMPQDIKWHQIGTLQTNKVKYIAPYVAMIHSVDSQHLLEIINKEAAKNGRVIDVLMEVFIATEESKHGWGMQELEQYIDSGAITNLTNVRVRGVMGMASFTDNKEQIRHEFATLKTLFDTLKTKLDHFDTLSMGMSGDYQIAIEQGATMVRVGSSIFGTRN